MKQLIRIHLAALAGGCALLAGCATTPTTSGSSYDACKEMVSITKTMTKIKPLLPKATQVKVGDALATAYGYCHTKTPPANSAQVVQGLANSLNTIIKEVDKSKGATK